MSAKGKRISYRIFLVVCGLAAIVGTIVIACTAIDYAKTDYSYLWAFGTAIAFLVLMSVNTLVHETGHLVFGALAGMRFSSIRFSRIRIMRVGKKVKCKFLRRSEVAGSCEMYPSGGKNVRGRMIAYTLGGAVFSLIYGGIFLALYFVLPLHPALYFFELFAPLSLLEAVASLYPAETATGKTDGAVVVGLIKNDPSAVVALRVMTAQGILSAGSFASFDRNLLFDLPVVREDDASFLALLQLRWDYLFFAGEEQAAFEQLERLETLYGYLPDLNRSEVACDLVYAYSTVSPDRARAERYLTDAAFGEGTCAYYRANAAYARLSGKDGTEYIKKALAVITEEPIVGIAELERKFLARLETGTEKAE